MRALRRGYADMLEVVSGNVSNIACFYVAFY